MTRKEKMKIYRRRQAALVICVGAVLIIIIIALITMFVTRDRKPIKTPPSSAASDAAIQEGSDVPAGGNDNTQQDDFRFEESEITIKVGERYTAKLSDNTGLNESYEWESSNTAVASVENGTITGISEGSCDITVRTVSSGLSAKLRVYVEADGTSGNHEVVEKDGMTYIDGVLIANKSYSLPADYDPGVSQEALDAFYEMQSDAAAEGLDIYISSDYRSYYDQERIYNSYVETDGQELADTYSSRPGYSDHQTGLAFDLNSIDDSFGYTPESDWVAANAHKYGFIIRFPEGKEAYTGYQYEPWHIRYVGVEMAGKIYESGLSLEEYFGITSEYSD